MPALAAAAVAEGARVRRRWAARPSSFRHARRQRAPEAAVAAPAAGLRSPIGLGVLGMHRRHPLLRRFSRQLHQLDRHQRLVIRPDAGQRVEDRHRRQHRPIGGLRRWRRPGLRRPLPESAAAWPPSPATTCPAWPAAASPPRRHPYAVRAAPPACARAPTNRLRARSTRPPRIAWIAARISATLANRRARSGCSARVTICCSRGSPGGGAGGPPSMARRSSAARR